MENKPVVTSEGRERETYRYSDGRVQSTNYCRQAQGCIVQLGNVANIL